MSDHSTKPQQLTLTALVKGSPKTKAQILSSWPDGDVPRPSPEALDDAVCELACAAKIQCLDTRWQSR